MSSTEWSYVVFGVVLVTAIIFDLGLLSKSSKTISINQALFQTIFWVLLAIVFFLFIWFQQGHITAIEYISAYLMEWSLSIDNIFVFILIFNFFGIKELYYGRVLLMGILMAIIFRVLFITIGIALVDRFEWILYVFGAFLVFTGIKMFFANQEEEVSLNDYKMYRFLQGILPITDVDYGGKYKVRINKKIFFTLLFVVVILLATTDIVFALDSIPAVFAITQNKMVIYTSNIFAVLGLRSLFFLLRGAVTKFEYLQQGIAIVLLFVGGKMLVQYFNVHIPVVLSLFVIVVCLVVSNIFSIYYKKINIREEITKPKT